MPLNNQPRRWKAELLNREWIASQEGSACYCLSDKTVQMLLTLTGTLYWHTRWKGNESFTPEQIEEIKSWAANAERELMNGCCGGGAEIPPIFGIDEDGNVIVSLDGGLTFEPAPNNDPRNVATQFQPLPITGDSGKCAGAENVAYQTEIVVTNMVEKLTIETAVGGVLAALLGLLAIFITVASAGTAIGAASLLVGFAAGLIGIGAAALDDAFDADVYEQFKCLVYCFIAEDQRLNAAALADLKAAVAAEFEDAIVIKVLTDLITSMGPQGMTNMARTGSSTGGSCGDCDCSDMWCWFADFEGANARGFSVDPAHGGFGTLGGGGWECEISPPDSVSLLTISREFDLTLISRMVLTYSNTMDTSHSDDDYLTYTPVTDGVEGISGGIYFDENHTNAEWVVEFDPPVSCNEMMFDMKAGTFAPYGTGTLHSVRFEGIGTPIDTENCEV